MFTAYLAQSFIQINNSSLYICLFCIKYFGDPSSRIRPNLHSKAKWKPPYVACMVAKELHLRWYRGFVIHNSLESSNWHRHMLLALGQKAITITSITFVQWGFFYQKLLKSLMDRAICYVWFYIYYRLYWKKTKAQQIFLANQSTPYLVMHKLVTNTKGDNYIFYQKNILLLYISEKT